MAEVVNPGIGIARWALAMAAKREVVAVAEALRPHRILIMPLKGIELVTRYGRGPTVRGFVDVDILIEPPHFDRAIEILGQAGFKQIQAGWSARSLLSPAGLVTLDVHRRLLPPLMGSFSATRVFRRGHRDTTSYETEVVCMDPSDLFVHLLCHYLKDRLPRHLAETLIADLEALLPHVSAASVREAAEGAGVRASCWLALDHVVQGRSAALREMLESLEPHATARARARIFRKLLLHWARSHPELSYAVTRATVDSAPRAVASASLSFLRAGRDLLRGQQGTAFRG